jgi:hypothetical protein
VTGHILAIGETQSGKTYSMNALHREGPPGLLSIFFNTNHVGYIWGTRVASLAQLVAAVARGDRRLNYVPPAGLEDATSHLWALWHYLMRYGAEGPVWCRLFVDEAQRFEPPGDREGPVEDATRRGLGKGIQVIVITQYSPGIKPGTRTNCPTRVLFKPGDEGRRFLLTTYGYPADVVDWTDRKRHWASKLPGGAWRLSPPVGTN